MFLTRCSPRGSKRELELALDLVEGGAGDHDAARLGQLLEPGGDVYAVAVDVAVALDDHVAQVDADAEADAPVLGTSASRSAMPRWIAAAQRDRIDHARELA